MKPVYLEYAAQWLRQNIFELKDAIRGTRDEQFKKMLIDRKAELEKDLADIEKHID